jgi:hypothetical protein
VADGTPLTAGRPFRSTIRNGTLFLFGAFARFSPDSARTKIPIAKMATTQEINRAALDVFILLVFLRASVSIVYIEPQLTLYGSTVDRHIAQVLSSKASRIFKRESGPERIFGGKR